MNNYYCFIFICFCLFSCGETTKGQGGSKGKDETSTSKATQKGKTPSNDREEDGLVGAVKSVIDFYERDSSVVVFDTLGRIEKEGVLYPVKGFSGHTYTFDSFGNPLKIYDGGRFYHPDDDFSTYFYDSIINTYNSKGQLITYETSDSSRDGYKCHLRYNDNGQLIEEKNTNLTDDDWYNLLEYAYDKNGFLTKKKIRREKDKLREMTLYENDKFGNVVKETFYSPSMKVKTTIYTLDAAGNQIEQVSTIRDLTYSEAEKIYYNKTVSKEDQEFDQESMESGLYPILTTKTVKTFDANNNCISTVTYQDENLQYKYSYVYDAYNNIIKTTSKGGEEAASVTNNQYEYDEGGNWVKRFYKYENDSLVLEAERIISYYK
jgi:hypothetical protein